MAKGKDKGAKSAAKPSGTNDFKDKAQKTVKGDGNKGQASGHTNDFEAGAGKKAVGSGGEEDLSKAYATEAKAQAGPDSRF